MKQGSQHGFTVVEMMITIIVFSVVALGTYGLLTSYITSATYAQVKAVAVSVASEEMERLRSLPYNRLAVQGGAIVISEAYLPATKNIQRSDRYFTVQTDIRYVDDAYDGCFNYPTQADRDKYCRNGPPDASKPFDNNPLDYKIAQVTVRDKNSQKAIATLSSQFAARVAEVASDTSMISVKVADQSGEGVAGASVNVKNTAVTPTIDQTITTDDTGSALFMDIKPDSGSNYVVTASKTGYSTLSTIPQSGTLVPTYPNTNAIAQNMSNVTLKINELSPSSLGIMAVNTSGAALAGQTLTLKGGIKLYTDANDQQYSYEANVTTDASGSINIGSLVPGDYRLSSSTQTLVALHVATGTYSFQPFLVPSGKIPISGMSTMQAVRVILSSDSTHPTIGSISPTSISTSDPYAGATSIKVEGSNLMGATVRLVQGGTVINGSPIAEIPDETGSVIVRSFNLAGIPLGAYRLEVVQGGRTAVQDSLSPSTTGAFNVTN